jgi:hypothetical protein
MTSLTGLAGPIARAALAAIIVLGTAGCSRGEDGADPSAGGPTLRVLVADSALRRLGEECSGAIPYLYIHKGSTVTFTATGGIEVSKRLPAGSAIRADSHDWGDSPRIPTNCSFVIDASGLEVGTAYWVAVEGHEVEHRYTYDPDVTFQDLPTVVIPSAPQEIP